jgi:hypothetical protein
VLTYLARPRGLYTEPPNATLTFPSRVETVFTFQPGASFGGEGPIGRIVPLGAKVRLEWDACRGETNVITDSPLPPVGLELDAADGSVHFEGPLMKVITKCESRLELQSFLETYYYALPAILSVDFLDVPIVSDVRGTIGEASFCWGPLDSGWSSFDSVTPEIQEKRIVTAYNRLKLLAESQEQGTIRLLAATEYFHVACQLNRLANRRWGFLAESLLNCAKILEVLFPAPPQQTIKSTREALTHLGFTEVEIEALYVPALALRNAIDVAHPNLAVFPVDDAAILYSYADAAEDGFRLLLRRLFQLLEEGKLSLEPARAISPSSEAQRIIKRLAANLQRYKEAQGASYS